MSTKKRGDSLEKTKKKVLVTEAKGLPPRSGSRRALPVAEANAGPLGAGSGAPLTKARGTEEPSPSSLKGLPIVSFRDAKEWSSWMAAQPVNSPGCWLRLKKGAAARGALTYGQALDEALCLGWIDSQKMRGDEQAFLQRFSPRKPSSVWSKINREKVEGFLLEGRMTPAGLATVELAKKNGRWDSAYEGAASAVVPEDLSAALSKDVLARKFFDALSSANRYAILYRLRTAKTPETRARRLAQAVQMLARGETFHPQKPR